MTTDRPADRDWNECPTCGCPTKCAEGEVQALKEHIDRLNDAVRRHTEEARR